MENQIGVRRVNNLECHKNSESNYIIKTFVAYVLFCDTRSTDIPIADFTFFRMFIADRGVAYFAFSCCGVLEADIADRWFAHRIKNGLRGL